MKLSEFEGKLTTVSNSKLRRMLAESRQHGPEVAVKLILAEALRRGLGLEEEAEPPLPDYVKQNPAPPAPAAASSDWGEALRGSGSPTEAPRTAEGTDLEAPAPDGVTKGAWLAEEADAGMPVFVKILLTLVVLGGAIGGLLFLLNKNG